MLLWTICSTALVAAEVTLYRALDGQNLVYSTACQCPAPVAIVSVPQYPASDVVGISADGMSGSAGSADGVHPGFADAASSDLPPGSSVISSSKSNGVQVIVYAVPEISVGVSLSVGVTINLGTATTFTNSVTTTTTTTATRTNTITGTGTAAPLSTASGSVSIAPGSTAQSASGPPFLNATSSSAAASSMNSATSSVLATQSTLPSSTSSSSLDVLAVLRAASATQFCSSVLGYMQTTTTTTETAARTSVSVVVQTFTSTFSSTVSGSTVTVSTATITTTVTSTLTQLLTATATSTSTSSSLSITSTTTVLQKRQAPVDLGRAGAAAISSACSQLIMAPIASTELVTTTSISTSTQSRSTNVIETDLSTTSSTSTSTMTDKTTATTTTSTSSTSTTTTGTTTTTTSIRPLATRVTIGRTPQSRNFLSSAGAFVVTIQLRSVIANYFVSASGFVVNAAMFDGGQAGETARFEVWRQAPSNTPQSGTNSYTLLFQSDPVTLTNSGTLIYFTIPAPIAVVANDTIGLYASSSVQVVDFPSQSLGDRAFTVFNSDSPPTKGQTYQGAGSNNGGFVNVQADVIYE